MTKLRIGLGSPIVALLPGAHAPWEAGAGIAELTQIAQAADRLGYDYLTCSEHVAVPQGALTSWGTPRGTVYWDPLATFGYVAACTERIRLATNVLVLGYHHPLEIAKRYGTLDTVSGGRLILGLGVGSLREEFDLLGVDFGERGARADDALRALRASLSRATVGYDGPYYSYRDFVVEPHTVQERVPMWIGGASNRSLRRALTLADGWVPFGLDVERLAGMLAAVTLPDGFEVTLAMGRADPQADQDGTVAALERLRGAGATAVTVGLVSQSLAHYLEQLEAFMHIAHSVREPG